MFYFLPSLVPIVSPNPNTRLIRTIDAAVSSTLITEGLKSVIREERPNGNDSRSFPSEHATMAFSIATVQAEYDPKSSVYWYAGASAVALWRVQSKDHYLQDVVAGGLIGYLTAKAEIRSKRGLIISPFFHSGSPGLALTMKF